MEDTRRLQVVISAQDEASRVLQSFAGKFQDLAKSAQAGAAIIAGSLSLVVKDAIQSGIEFQNARTAFETFLGSGEKAGKLLSDLSTFAAKTPFDLPQVVDGTKRLLAYGVAANDVIPTFRVLGDISSGNKAKFDQLVLAYGQVRAATKLTGAELRQFTEAGVPLLDALAEMYNKTSKSATGFATVQKNSKIDVQKINEQIGILNQKMSENKEKYKEGSVAYREAQLKLKGYQDQLSKATITVGGLGKASKLTAADIKDMISDNKVTFDDVTKALSTLNGEGGRFFQNMERQSRTLGGVLSNTRDEFIRFTLSALGFITQGENAGMVREGSFFYYLQLGAERFLQVIQQVRPQMEQFVDSFLKNMPSVSALIGGLVGLLTPLVLGFISLIAPALLFVAAGAAIGGVIALVIQNLDRLQPYFPIILGAFAAIGTFILGTVIPAFIGWATAAVTAAIGTFVALLPVIAICALVGVAVAALYVAWKNNFGGIQEKTKAVVDWFAFVGVPTFKQNFDLAKEGVVNLAKTWIDNFNKIVDVIQKVIDLAGRVKNAVSNEKGGFKIPGFQHGGVVQGSYGDAIPALLHPGERVIPRNGVDVNTSPSSTPNVTIQISGTFNLDSEERVQELADKIIRILGRQNELAGKGVGY